MSTSIQRLKLLVAILLYVMCVSCSSYTHEKPLSFARLDAQLQRQIQSRTTEREILLECISHLGRRSEEPGFWTKIANDATYSEEHRARCIMALFRRHGKRCATLMELSDALKPCQW